MLIACSSFYKEEHQRHLSCLQHYLQVTIFKRLVSVGRPSLLLLFFHPDIGSSKPIDQPYHENESRTQKKAANPTKNSILNKKRPFETWRKFGCHWEVMRNMFDCCVLFVLPIKSCEQTKNLERENGEFLRISVLVSFVDFTTRTFLSLSKNTVGESVLTAQQLLRGSSFRIEGLPAVNSLGGGSFRTRVIPFVCFVGQQRNRHTIWFGISRRFGIPRKVALGLRLVWLAIVWVVLTARNDIIFV